MKSPILGGQYITRSTNAGANRCINLYAEQIAEGGKEPGFLTRCPGLLRKVTVGSGPFRGGMRVDDKAYIVSGSKLYKVSETYTVTEIGDISAGSSQVYMSYNGLQIMIACGQDGYIYDFATEEVTEITDEDFPGAVTVDYLDGMFVFNEPASGKLWVTALLDGTDIDSLDFSTAEGNPDNIVAIRVSHREVWVFGEDSTEVYYNSGNADFPLERIQGAFIEVGCAAIGSIAKLDNSLFWLGSDARGTRTIYRAEGYTATRISNHSIESIIQEFRAISDTVAYTYQQAGHSFYMITFPSADRTFCYDVATSLWHERADYTDGEFHRHRARGMFLFNDQVHVGDRLSGNIYVFDLNTYTDNGKEQRWLRSWRALSTGKNSLRRMIHHQLQLDCEIGTGTNAGQGVGAEVMLRWSDDGGHTFGNYHVKSIGKIGKFLWKCIWKRLGMSRDRIYELSGSDPNKIVIMGAELKATELNS